MHCWSLSRQKVINGEYLSCCTVFYCLSFQICQTKDSCLSILNRTNFPPYHLIIMLAYWNFRKSVFLKVYLYFFEKYFIVYLKYTKWSHRLLHLYSKIITTVKQINMSTVSHNCVCNKSILCKFPLYSIINYNSHVVYLLNNPS